ncbi:MAG: GtrA family protein [Actinomycetes bacterium]
MTVELVEPVEPEAAPTRMRRRVVGYSLGSIVAATTSEAAFLVVYGWLAGGPVWASLAGFFGGAVPNYFLNRRLAWADRRRPGGRGELIRYAVVSAASFGASVAATHQAESWAHRHYDDRSWRVLAVGATYLAVSAVFFVAKFVLYHLVVFTGTAGEPEPAPPTTS